MASAKPTQSTSSNNISIMMRFSRRGRRGRDNDVENIEDPKEGTSRSQSQSYPAENKNKRKRNISDSEDDEIDESEDSKLRVNVEEVESSDTSCHLSDDENDHATNTTRKNKKSKPSKSKKNTKLKNSEVKSSKSKILQRFRKKWISKYAWASSSKLGDLYFNCRDCGKSYSCAQSGITSLKRHCATKRHKEKVVSSKEIQKSNIFQQCRDESLLNDEARKIELQLAMLIVKQNLPFSLADDLIEFMKSVDLSKAVQRKLPCERTECTAHVCNVIGQHNSDLLIEKLKKNPFSLIIDESTDIGTIKHLILVARHVGSINPADKSEGVEADDFQVHDDFLALLEVQDGTHNGLYNSIVQFFSDNGIPYKDNLIGFASDSASVMMGKDGSVSAKLKSDVRTLFIMKCICHSLALAVSHSLKKLPSYLEETASNIYCYLKYSSKRQNALEQLQNLFEIPQHFLLKLNKVCWLSLEMVINKLIEQYPVLLTYFEKESKNRKDDDPASIIFKNLTNPFTIIYYEFLHHVLRLVNKRNLEFQSEKTSIHLLHSKMETLFKSIIEMYIDESYVDMYDAEFLEFSQKTSHWLPIKSVNIGPTAKAELNSLSNSHPNIKEDDKITFRRVCREFLIDLASQINLRFPFQDRHIKMLRKLSFIDPQNLKQIKDITEVAHQFGYDVEVVYDEFKKLRQMMKSSTETDTNKFWKTVQSLRSADSTPEFPIIPTIVKKIKLLPHSSANCEKIFSAINLNKTKSRNKLSTETLIGILHSKSLMKGKKSILDINYAPFLPLITQKMYE